MKFKLDENFDTRFTAFLEAEGHDADTVLSEGLSGHDDDAIYDACLVANRVLITLDMDFANPFRFPPDASEGIVVVRPPRQTLAIIRATLLSILPQLKTQSLKGTLWIVEPGRIRVFDPHE